MKQQGTPEWFKEHLVRLAASLFKDIVSLKSDKGIMNVHNVLCIYSTKKNKEIVFEGL